MGAVFDVLFDVSDLDADAALDLPAAPDLLVVPDLPVVPDLLVLRRVRRRVVPLDASSVDSLDSESELSAISVKLPRGSWPRLDRAPRAR
ncbi:MAG: hypothetical protein SangKO_004180 [Sandaracinaceae bacterium]